jgi:hypothetical protein
MMKRSAEQPYSLHLQKVLMDCRVKPGNDSCESGAKHPPTLQRGPMDMALDTAPAARPD